MQSSQHTCRNAEHKWKRSYIKKTGSCDLRGKKRQDCMILIFARVIWPTLCRPSPAVCSEWAWNYRFLNRKTDTLAFVHPGGLWGRTTSMKQWYISRRNLYIPTSGAKPRERDRTNICQNKPPTRPTTTIPCPIPSSRLIRPHPASSFGAQKRISCIGHSIIARGTQLHSTFVHGERWWNKESSLRSHYLS